MTHNWALSGRGTGKGRRGGEKEKKEWIKGKKEKRNCSSFIIKTESRLLDGAAS